MQTTKNGPRQSTNPTIKNEEFLNADEVCTEHSSKASKVLFLSLPNLHLFGAICIFRILNTFLVQSYFDPDEFWQTMEPAYCEVFFERPKDCPGYTWEWKRRLPSELGPANLIERSMWGPARSYLSVVPVYYYYWVLKYFGFDTFWLVSRGPMILNALIVAAPIDMSVWYSGRWLKPRKYHSNTTIPDWCLFCSLSSWFNGYSLVRTLANSQEDLLLILAVALVSPELIGNVDQDRAFFRSSLAFFLGGLSVVIRFTAIAAFVPMGIILALRNKKMRSRITFLLLPCATFGFLGVSFGMVVDRLFFGFWTIPFLGNFHFNVVQDFASLFGAHPWHWYFTSGLPAIAGLLLPFACFDCLELVRRRGCDQGQCNLWIIVLSYLVVMSFNAHKEFRYILPVLPLICLLTAGHVLSICVLCARKTKLFRVSHFGFLFALANLVAVVYLGLFHQTGPIAVNKKIVARSKEILQVTPRRKTFVVHYLTGGCHSTPLLSSLHSPPLNFDKVWHLDCSPGCRSNPNSVCESERFAIDPVRFIEEAYFPCRRSKWSIWKRCISDKSKRKLAPDFIVTFVTYAEHIRSLLGREGLEEVDRFPHNVNGLRLGNLEVRSDNLNNPKYRHFTFLHSFLEVSLEEVVLFARN